MTFDICLTEEAAADVEHLHAWLSDNVSDATADYVLDRIDDAIESLRTFPVRNPAPHDLRDLDTQRYRETFFKPNRIVYRVKGSIVLVELITDGRRNMRRLNTDRLKTD